MAEDCSGLQDINGWQNPDQIVLDWQSDGDTLTWTLDSPCGERVVWSIRKVAGARSKGGQGKPLPPWQLYRNGERVSLHRTRSDAEVAALYSERWELFQTVD